ncbi:MAG TPA: cytochrome P450 [Mycobacteriales bacterium]|nr:cytochrome P450 [Mycobacteriales bacterium]
MPARLTAHLIGFDDGVAPALRSWSERLMRIDRLMSEPLVGADFMMAIMEFAQVVNPLIEERRAAPADDLISVWVGAELDNARIGDAEIAEGDRVMLLYPSANRDERSFADPYRFDIRRRPNPHVAFGFGTHFCLGSSLARLELRLLLTALTKRSTALEVLEGPDIEPNIFAGAVRSCRLGFRPRSAG